MRETERDRETESERGGGRKWEGEKRGGIKDGDSFQC